MLILGGVEVVRRCLAPGGVGRLDLELFWAASDNSKPGGRPQPELAFPFVRHETQSASASSSAFGTNASTWAPLGQFPGDPLLK